MPAATAAAVQTPAPADVAAEAMRMVKKFVKWWDDGYTGSEVAILLRETFPDMCADLAPILTEEKAIDEFVRSTPELSLLPREEGWPEFREEFLREMKGEGPGPDEEAGETKPPDGGTAAASE
jgi:hypothetical protein